jgi:ribosomal protein L11 methyltransferase
VIRLAVRVIAAHAEIVLAELLELVPNGVEEVELDGGARIEYAVYGAPGELPDLPRLQAAAGPVRIEVSSSAIADDWGERWKRFHRPVLIASPVPAAIPAVRVLPPWEAAQDEGIAAVRTSGSGTGESTSGSGTSRSGTGGQRVERAKRDAGRETVEIVIDPGQAFGTGGHASTRLCLELLLALAAAQPSRGPLLDVGTGSGVLAIAAAKLGYRPVTGLDYDPASVLAAAQNASANDVRVDVRRLDLRTEPIPAFGPSPAFGPIQAAAAPTPAQTVIVANLLRPLLLDLARALAAAPSHLLAGGLLAGEADEIAGAYADRLGMVERERRHSGEWAAVWMSAG